MRFLFKLSVVSVSLLTLSSVASAAAPSTTELQSEIQLIMAHDRQLQKEVHALKAQLQAQHTAQKHNKAPHAATTVSSSSAVATSPNEHDLLDRFGHGITVTTSPLTGNNTVGNASDILEQASKQNEQLTVLQQQATYMNYLSAENDDLYRPVIELSGGLEGQLYGVEGYGKDNASNGITLGTAELDVAALVGPWASGFMALDYNNAPISSGNRAPTGTVYLDRGFATIGNLNQSPFYFSIGEMYVPFGRYSSIMLSTPVTQSLARTKSPTALFGVSYDGMYASLFGYSGSQTSGGSDIIKQGGVDAGYTHPFGINGVNSIDAGVGVESNIADSQGLQGTGATNSSQFQGFANEPNGNDLVSRVPALDAHSTLVYNNWTGIAEFISTLDSFNVADLSYGPSITDLSGAAPKALHLEVDYTWHQFAKPITFGADYDHTWQALAANLPEASYTADIQTSLFANTVEELEYRHDDNYSASAAAGGVGSTPFTGNGEGRNTYLAQLGVYF